MNLSRWYRRWVRLYPNPFRAEYGEELVLLFEETWRDSASNPSSRRLRLLAFVAWDGIRSLIKEWGAALGWPIKVLIAGTTLMLLSDVFSGFRSGVVNAGYFWFSLGLTAALVRSVRRRHSTVAVAVMTANATLLYFGASLLRWFATVNGTHPRFGTALDLFDLMLVIYAIGVQLYFWRAKSRPTIRGWFEERPLLIFLSVLCVASSAGGMVRAGVLHHSDDTWFFLFVGSVLMDLFQTTWTRPSLSAPSGEN